MRILLTGATGFVGTPLLKALHEQTHDCVVLTRNPNRTHPHATLVGWSDPKHTLPPAEAFEGVDAVIHLAGEGVAEKLWTASQKKELEDSRILVTRNLIQGIAAASSRPRVFVAASAIGFYGDREDEVLSEDSPPGEGFLPELSSRWEKESLSAEELGLRTVVLRIGIVLGTEGGALKKMLTPFKLGLGAVLGSGNQWMSWIHRQDLVRLIVASVENPAYSGIINAVAPEPVTNRQFSKQLGKSLGRPVIFAAPSFALKAAMGEMSRIVLASQRVVPTQAKKQGFEFQFAQLSDALGNLLSK